MFKCDKNTFWLKNPTNLICDLNLLPLKSMSFSEQLNCLTKLTLIIFFILLLVDFKYSFVFLLISLAFIIILYYLQKKQMPKENYQYEGDFNRRVQKSLHNYPQPQDWSMIKQQPGLQHLKPLQLDKTPDNPGVFNNPEFMSNNQRLVGKPNPNTLIAPVVVPKCSDLDYWRTNNLVEHSAINSESQIDVYQSGYQVSTCCPPNLTGKGFADVQTS